MLYKLHCKYMHWRYHRKASGTPVQPLYEQPLIEGKSLFASTRFLVLDCEMSGLDVKHCQLLSIGWIVIENGRIVNASARHQLIPVSYTHLRAHETKTRISCCVV